MEFVLNNEKTFPFEEISQCQHCWIVDDFWWIDAIYIRISFLVRKHGGRQTETYLLWDKNGDEWRRIELAETIRKSSLVVDNQQTSFGNFYKCDKTFSSLPLMKNTHVLHMCFTCGSHVELEQSHMIHIWFTCEPHVNWNTCKNPHVNHMWLFQFHMWTTCVSHVGFYMCIFRKGPALYTT